MKVQRYLFGHFNLENDSLQVPLLDGYQTVEQCSIEYRPETGARIDPHIDDCWVWGERIVQLNMASDSVLTLFPYCDSLQGDKSKYNLADVATFPKVPNTQHSSAISPPIILPIFVVVLSR